MPSTQRNQEALKNVRKLDRPLSFLHVVLKLDYRSDAVTRICKLLSVSSLP